MKTFKIAELKTYSEVGLLQEINIQEDVSGQYMVTASFKTDKLTGDFELAALGTFRGKFRYFKTIDAAHNAVRKIDLGRPIYIQPYSDESCQTDNRGMGA